MINGWPVELFHMRCLGLCFINTALISRLYTSSHNPPHVNWPLTLLTLFTSSLGLYDLLHPLGYNTATYRTNLVILSLVKKSWKKYWIAACSGPVFSSSDCDSFVVWTHSHYSRSRSYSTLHQLAEESDAVSVKYGVTTVSRCRATVLLLLLLLLCFWSLIPS